MDKPAFRENIRLWTRVALLLCTASRCAAQEPAEPAAGATPRWTDGPISLTWEPDHLRLELPAGYRCLTEPVEVQAAADSENLLFPCEDRRAVILAADNKLTATLFATAGSFDIPHADFTDAERADDYRSLQSWLQRTNADRVANGFRAAELTGWYGRPTRDLGPPEKEHDYYTVQFGTEPRVLFSESHQNAKEALVLVASVAPNEARYLLPEFQKLAAGVSLVDESTAPASPPPASPPSDEKKEESPSQVLPHLGMGNGGKSDAPAEAPAEHVAPAETPPNVRVEHEEKPLFTAFKTFAGFIAAAVVACFRSVKKTVLRIRQMLGLGPAEAYNDSSAMPDLLPSDTPPPILPEHVE